MSTTSDAADELSFGQAMEALESVLRRIEGDEIDIDLLGAELGRAAELLEICRKKIRRAEVEVQQIVEAIEEDAADADEASAGDHDDDDKAAVPAGDRDLPAFPAADPDDDIPF